MSRCEASGIDTRHALFAARAAKFHISRDRSDEGQSSGLPMTTNFGSVTCRSRVLRRLVIMGMSLTAFSLGPRGAKRKEPTAGATIDAVVERIIGVESTAIQARQTNALAQRWRSCQQWRMPTPPSLWQPPT